MPGRAQIHVAVNDKVRLYQGTDDWFSPGTVTEVCPSSLTADVDFGDWVQRYALADLRVYWPEDGTYERCLVPLNAGEIIEDFREEDQTILA